MLRTVIVDDSEDVRALWRAALDQSGEFEVCGLAADGPSAVEIVRREQPDVVVLDLSMPGQHGLDTLPLLQEVAPESRVAVVSSASRREFADRATSLGACGFLEKHLPVQTLPSRLLQLVSQEPGDHTDQPSVLVVETSPERRALLEYLLGWLPVDPTVAADAADGLARLEKLRPSAALINAHSAAQRALYDACVAADVPVVCLHCLVQPFSAEELGAALRGCIDRAPVETTAEQAKARLVEEVGDEDGNAAWTSFERNTAERVAAARRAIRSGDLTELAAIAHALTGAAAMIGLTELAEVSGRLEDAARSGDLGRAIALADRLPTVPEPRGRLRRWFAGE